MNYLIDCIEEYRDYKGVYSEYSRRAFVERFLVLRGGQWEEGDHHRDAVVEWACETLYHCVAGGGAAGRMLRESILREVEDDACERLLSAIRDVADDIELTEEEEKENDDDNDDN
jgi:hypothetical protein